MTVDCEFPGTGSDDRDYNTVYSAADPNLLAGDNNVGYDKQVTHYSDEPLQYQRSS